MKFRKAKIEDLPIITSIFLSCWKSSYREVLSDAVREKMDTAAATELWSASFKNPDRTTFLVGESEKADAVFRTGIDPENPSRWHLFSLYVDPASAGRGIGSAVMNELIDQAKLEGKSEISLWVFDKNIVAKGLYSKFNFKPSGRTRVTESWGENEVELVRVNI